MYCKHCGKEISDDSKFCQHCGKGQANYSQSLSNVPVWIIYIIWSIAHLYLLTGKKSSASKNFFPYQEIEYFKAGVGNVHETFINWNKNVYDFSEFIVYVFIVPGIIWVLYKLFFKVVGRFKK